MTRTVSNDFAAHIAAPAATLALCALVTLRVTSGSPPVPISLGFTSWDKDLSIDLGDGAVNYVAARGLSVSQVQGNSDGAVDHLEVTILPADASISADDILAGKWHGAAIKLFLVNPEDLTQGVASLRSGTIGNAKVSDQVISAEFLGRLQALQSTIGETVTATCQNEFCGAVDARGRGCGLDLADFTFTGSVTGWDPDGIVVDSVDFASFPNNQFNDGRLVFDAEPWISFGIRFSIQEDGILALKQMPPFTVTPGMTFTVYEGCAKTIEVCSEAPRENVARFRGFPYLKGADKLAQFGHKQ